MSVYSTSVRHVKPDTLSTMVTAVRVKKPTVLPFRSHNVSLQRKCTSQSRGGVVDTLVPRISVGGAVGTQRLP